MKTIEKAEEGSRSENIYRKPENMNLPEIKTLGELKKQVAPYTQEGIKEELRRNLIAALKNGDNPFEGIHGYENTVIPELQRAILSKHNINLLGLRGQAKTRIARMMVNLLDEWMPIVAGSEVTMTRSDLCRDTQKTPLQNWEMKLQFPGYIETIALWKNSPHPMLLWRI